MNLEDRSKAKGLLDEGLTIAEKLGMKPLHERITERLAKLKGKVTYDSRPEPPDTADFIQEVIGATPPWVVEVIRGLDYLYSYFNPH